MGQPRKFFSQPALTDLAVITFAAAIVSIFSSAGLSTGIKEDRGNRWVIPIAVLSLLHAYIPPYTDWADGQFSSTDRLIRNVRIAPKPHVELSRSVLQGERTNRRKGQADPELYPRPAAAPFRPLTNSPELPRP